jgi:hypothetical protein
MLEHEHDVGRGVLALENALDDPLERAMRAEEPHDGGMAGGRVCVCGRVCGRGRVCVCWRGRGRGRAPLLRQLLDRVHVRCDVFLAQDETTVNQRFGVHIASWRTRRLATEAQNHLQVHVREDHKHV